MRKRCYIVSLFLIFIIMTFYTNTDTASSRTQQGGNPAPSVNIHGYVFFTNSSPITEALVSVDFNGTIMYDFSDSEGYYTIFEPFYYVSSGQYTVTATYSYCNTFGCSTCNPVEHTLTVNSYLDAIAEIDFYIECRNPSTTPRHSIIDGCVYDSVTESPIAECEVTVWNEQMEPSTVYTLPSGCYVQFVQPGGGWGITAAKTGYDPKTYSDVSVGSLEVVTKDFYLEPETRVMPWLHLLLGD